MCYGVALRYRTVAVLGVAPVVAHGRIERDVGAPGDKMIHGWSEQRPPERLGRLVRRSLLGGASMLTGLLSTRAPQWLSNVCREIGWAARLTERKGGV